jgi:anthranilate synthase component 1
MLKLGQVLSMTNKYNISKADFISKAKLGDVVPVFSTLFGGNDTPVGMYEKLSAGRSGTFLLESAEQGVWSRYSFIGVASRTSFIETDKDFLITNPKLALPSSDDLPSKPLEAIRLVQASWNTIAMPDLPPLTSGLVGLFSWDVIRDIENLPAAPAQDYARPKIHLEMVQDVIVLDHKTSSVLVVSNIYCDSSTDYDQAYEEAISRIQALETKLAEPTAQALSTATEGTHLQRTPRTSHEDFISAVEKGKVHVVAGDVFQVVLSQRIDMEVKARPIDVYRVLRALNPSPYMYLLNYSDASGEYAVVGSSPEALVKVSGNKVVMHPIAGSRPRGKDQGQDEEFADSLIADQKERAEHLMLVDLARNDLLKVCDPASVTVTQFMKIERFSHIMHLVSTVEGDLGAGKTPVDVFKATFPAGTLSGAPKPRALEIINDLESANRGIFGGVVGYLDFEGNADLAIAIRTAFIRDGVARVQAGAGIVLDSVPESEYQETLAKMSAVLTSIDQANALFGSK